jgi:putative CocE/NonD family hydrolase
MANATPEARTRHYLVIGPWDHDGTRTPKTEFGGLKLGPHVLLNIEKLHLQWYAWAMQGGREPDFLKKHVAYYVMYTDRWRYADSLEAITADTRTLYLDSTANATDVLSSGTLVTHASTGHPDYYVYDPHDLSSAELESTVDPDSLVDQRMIYALRGKELVYHSAPFARDTEISGFFELTTWVAIDQPDTDFVVNIYEIREDGTSLLLTSEQLRARYRESLRASKLILTKAPLRYDFAHFPFVSQEVKKGSRLRLVIQPLNSLYSEKNYNSGGTVSEETMRDAQAVTVTLFHDRAHPSALLVPLGRPVAADELTPPESMFTTEKR